MHRRRWRVQPVPRGIRSTGNALVVGWLDGPNLRQPTPEFLDTFRMRTACPDTVTQRWDFEQVGEYKRAMAVSLISVHFRCFQNFVIRYRNYSALAYESIVDVVRYLYRDVS